MRAMTGGVNARAADPSPVTVQDANAREITPAAISTAAWPRAFGSPVPSAAASSAAVRTPV